MLAQRRQPNPGDFFWTENRVFTIVDVCGLPALPVFFSPGISTIRPGLLNPSHRDPLTSGSQEIENDGREHPDSLYYPVMLSRFSPAPVNTDRAARIQ